MATSKKQPPQDQTPAGQTPPSPGQPPAGQPPQGPPAPQNSFLDETLASGRRIPVSVAGDRADTQPVRIVGPDPDGVFQVSGPGPGGSFEVNGPGPQGSFRVSGTEPDGSFRVGGNEPDGSVRISGPGENGSFPVAPTGPLSVNLQRSESLATGDQPLWVAIRMTTRAIGFDNYARFITRVLCEGTVVPERVRHRREGADLLHGVDAYQLLRTATEAFLLVHCGVAIRQEDYNQDEERGRLGRDLSHRQISDLLTSYLGNGILPYLDRVTEGLQSGLDESPFCSDRIPNGLLGPCLLELIWSYWHEEGMLVQAINAVSLRFQNKRGPGDREPLANFELHPLRPLTNLLWGYIQDEDHRLTVARRAYEYEHHYGLGLVGKAVPKLRPADRRSKFLEAFHGLLHQAALFYERDANTTIIADGFPLLNALREVHMILAEGAHNQFRDLPWTARVEMLVQQWLLARHEMREFLGGRAMVPYAEPWMVQVESLKRLQGWPDTPVTPFHDLAVHGEQIILSIRYGDWSVVNDQDQARNWVRYWRPEIQRYIHAYQAATGVDLAATSQDKQAGLRINATPPSVLLQQRAAQQRSR
jgi:hypothetical protein